MFKNILVPTDGSAMSRRALARAMRLAKEQKAHVTALWVGPAWEPNLYAYDKAVPRGFVSPKEHAVRVRKLATRYLDPARKAASSTGVPCARHFVEGAFPHLEIIRAADRHHCDLIVMASHGRRGISRFLLGSVAGMVLAHARVPVLICR